MILTRMNKKKLVFRSAFVALSCSLSLFSLSVNLHAQQSTLTIDAAIETALTNNPEIKLGKLELRKAEAQVDEAFGYALPSVNITGQYVRNLQLPVFFAPAAFGGAPSSSGSASANPVAIRLGADNSYQIQGQLTQTLFNSTVFRGISGSKMYVDAAKERLYANIVKTLLTTKKAFYGALLSKDLLDVSRASLAAAEENLRNVQNSYKQGVASEYDALRAEVQVENIRPIVLQAENQYLIAKNALKIAVGLETTADIDVQGSLENSAATMAQDEKQLLTKAVNQNYDLRALEMQKRVSNEYIAVNESGFYPVVSAFANYSMQGQSNTFSFTNVNSSSVGLQFQIPIFQGFQTKAKVEQSKIDFLKIEEQQRQLQDGIKVQVQNAVLQLKLAERKLTAIGKTIEQAQRGYTIATARYKNGLGNQLEITDADLALRQARGNRLQAIYEYVTAKTDLEILAGEVDQKYFKLQ